MGVQYIAKKEDLLAAGCILGVYVETYKDYNGEIIEYKLLTCEYNGYKFFSYSENSLIVDCNEWGSNKHRLTAAGMFEIPHIVC